MGSLHTPKSKQLIESLAGEITNFKSRYNDSPLIQKRIDGLESLIAELERKKARLELNSDCDAYETLQNEMARTENEIRVLENQLEEDQSNYLDKFFEKINKLFKKLGSKNFTLEKESESRGYLPVYSLKVRFHGVNIQNEKLNSVFSESDRRALAFSVFLAKLNLKSEEEKLKTIVILDDPVTSFDDNRVTNSINIFKNSLSKISQLIILMHCPHLIKRFYEITKASEIAFKFIELKLNEVSSCLKSSDIKQFNSSDYEKVFLKIDGFVKHVHSECIKADLRPFLETLYLPMVFAKRIKDKSIDCNSLEKMIDGIFEDDEITKNKFHQFRKNLNPDSHIFTTNNEEDVRSFASDMMDYLYSLKFEVVHE